jgi:hypothetical protein
VACGTRPSFCPNTTNKDGVGHTSRSSGLLHLEASRARVSQCSLKTGRAMVRMVHVASSRRSCGDEAKDGQVDAMSCIGHFYPNFAIFIVLGHKGTLLISFPINRTPRASGEATVQSSLSHPLAIVAFKRCGSATWCKRGKERKWEIPPIIQRVGGCCGSFHTL